MNTLVYIVLSSVFGNVRCVHVINIQKPINLIFKVHTDQNDVAKNRQMKSNSDKMMPSLINEDDPTFDNINFRANDRELKFSDFILEVAMTLKTYEENVLKDILAILDDELRKSDYNGCKSHELVKLKEYLCYQLGVLKDTPVEIIRDNLDNMITILKKENYGELAETVELVNSFYMGKSDTFIKVLMVLMMKKISPSIDLGYVIRLTLRNLFLDHYCNLSEEIRHELIPKIEHYSKPFVNLRTNNGIDRNQNKVKFVTPIGHVEQFRKANKNIRLKTANERRTAITNKNDKSDNYEYTTNNYKLEKRRFEIVSNKIPTVKIKDYQSNSYEHMTKYSTKNYKLVSSSEAGKHYVDKRHRILKTQEIRLRSLNDPSVLYDSEVAEMIRNRNIEDSLLDYTDMNNNTKHPFEDSVAESKRNKEIERIPIQILRKPDLNKLVKIRALAEEINDMIVSEQNTTRKHEALRIGKDVTDETGVDINDVRALNKKIERQGGSSDLKPLFINVPFKFSDSNVNITTLISKNKKENNGKKNKDIVVIMNVKYD